MSQEEIAAQLKSEAIATISDGINGASRIPRQDWTPGLREAILYALKMEQERDAEAARQGVQRFFDENLAASLARLAVATQDPAAIPLLVQVHGIGAVSAALVAFGRLAVPDMIRVVKEGEFGAATSCLISLRHMVQVRGLVYFTLAERAELKALVALFLMPGKPMIRDDLAKVVVLRRVVQLALALDDSEARRWIENLATDSDAFQEKVGTPLSDFHSRRLQDLLDGAALLPEPEPLSAYFEEWRKRGQFGLGDQRQ